MQEAAAILDPQNRNQGRCVVLLTSRREVESHFLSLASVLPLRGRGILEPGEVS